MTINQFVIMFISLGTVVEVVGLYAMFGKYKKDVLFRLIGVVCLFVSSLALLLAIGAYAQLH